MSIQQPGQGREAAEAHEEHNKDQRAAAETEVAAYDANKGSAPSAEADRRPAQQTGFAEVGVANAQGLDEIRTASQEYGWDINVAEVAKIWRAGCIIRAKLLERIRSEYPRATW